MTDENDNSTGQLPLDTMDPPAPAAKPKRKSTPRAKYSEPMLMRCRAGKAPDAPSVLLVTAMSTCGVPHKVIDEMYGLAEGTVLEYMKTGTPAEGFGDDQAYEVFDILHAMVESGAWTPSGLSLPGIIAAMRGYGQVCAADAVR